MVGSFVSVALPCGMRVSITTGTDGSAQTGADRPPGSIGAQPHRSGRGVAHHPSSGEPGDEWAAGAGAGIAASAFSQAHAGNRALDPWRGDISTGNRAHS